MKINFKSQFSSPDNVPLKLRQILESLKDGDVYSTRDIGVLGKTKQFSQYSPQCQELGYAYKMQGANSPPCVWWGNKKTIAELKKQFTKK